MHSRTEVTLILLLTCLAVVKSVDFPSLDNLQPIASLPEQGKAAQDLIVRVLGYPEASHFKVVIIENAQQGQARMDVFNLMSDGKLVTITATTGIAASMGFYYYLKTYCDCQVTWAGQQLALPSELPVIEKPGIIVSANDRFRYYQNVCTASYSFVWWDWPRWERHIDWMAMNGINLPLAFTGQEAIFQRVYRRMGLTIEELQSHFGGPAFLAWARMGNMHGWGGPIPQYWIDEQLVLQHRILARMRELGMIPVLPGFAGHVPMAISRIYPNASVSRLRDWGHFNETYCCTYLLDFEDPLFRKIGSEFIKEMQNEFGVDHVYNADSFNEMTPKSSSTTYLRSAGDAVFTAMTDADPQAIWLMQGWLFHSDPVFWRPQQVEALLTAVPTGRMIVLDLFAEVAPVYLTTSNFHGQPYIWCMLHNFGGTMELYGDITSINTGPFMARELLNSSMVGTGLTPEGIFQNEVIYEFMNENAWAAKPRNLTQWFDEFPRRRYGRSNSNINQAWNLLKKSVYNCTDRLTDHSRQVIPTSRPRLDPPLHQDIWYDPQDLFQAWGYLVKSSQEFSNSSLFRYDLVDVSRNSLQLISLKLYTELILGYQTRNVTLISVSASKLLGLLSDLDSLLASDSHFLLGRWLKAAREKGTTDAESDLMEYNARNQITLWGPSGGILDYAVKQWSGLIKSYSYPRWQLFCNMLMDSVKKGERFNKTAFETLVFEKVEQPFTLDHTVYPDEPVGDPVALSHDAYVKYLPETMTDYFRKLKKWVSEQREDFMKDSRHKHSTSDKRSQGGRNMLAAVIELLRKKVQ